MTEPLTADRIVKAAEEVFRRFGPQKTTVVDVARALGVSHGAVYRHFPSKAALREAVARGWLHAITEPLAAIAAGDAPADARLCEWLTALHALKRRKVLDDPEMFANYTALAEEAREVIEAHVAALATQVARIVADGIAERRFAAADPARTARAVLDATARYHHPLHAGEWQDEGSAERLGVVLDLVVAGLARR